MVSYGGGGGGGKLQLHQYFDTLSGDNCCADSVCDGRSAKYWHGVILAVNHW